MSASPNPVRCPLLIGRDGLLDLAERRLDEVGAGRGQFLLVAGEAGIGKTRFLDAIVQRAGARGIRSIWGSVTPQDQDVAGASIFDLARAMSRMPAFADVGRDLLALRAGTMAPHHARRRNLVIEIVDRLLSCVSAPTVVGFEDLQWSDDLSLEIIAELARQARGSHLLILGGYRSDEAPPGTSLRAWRSRLVTQRLAEEIRLAPLSPAETALVTSLILDSGLPAPREVAAAVYERTDGIPLHIEELLGALGADARASGVAIREATVPDTIEDAVLVRLSHRSAPAQATARAGAVIGRSFDAATLAGVLDQPVESLDDPLQELVDGFVLDPPGPQGIYDFRHQLLRDAVYRSVPAAERRRLHARAADHGSRLEGHSVIHASLHFELAGLRDAAYGSALEGARDAVRLAAHREAFDLFRRAVRHRPPDQSPADRGALFAAFAYEAVALERIDIAIEAATTAAGAFRDAGRPAVALEVLEIVASIWRRQGLPTSERLAAALDAASTVAALEPSADVVRVRALVKARLAVTQLDAFDLGAARTTVAHAAQDATAVDDRELMLLADSIAAALAVHTGEVEAGLDDMLRTAEAQEAIGSDEALGSYRDGSELAVQHFRYRSALELIEAGTHYAALIEQRHCAHVMAGTAAYIQWAQGDWDGAVARAEQAVADDGCERAKAVARWSIGLVALGRGDQRRANDALEASVAFADEGEVTDVWTTPWWGLAEADLLADQPAKARDRCRAALARIRVGGPPVLLAPFIVTGVRAALAGDGSVTARAWLDEVVAVLSGFPELAAATAAPVAHSLGLIALTEGSTGIAKAQLEAAVAGWERVERTWEASWARLDLATCLTRTNEFAAAVAAADEVRQTAARLGSPILRERADTLLRKARGRVAIDEPWRPLSAREFAVARLIADGRTNAQIADELGIAPKTASSHVEHILAKLGASRRTEIATWASQVHAASTAG